MLVAPVDFQNDRDNLFEETIQTAKGADADSDLYRINIEEVDAMEPIQFEEWVISLLKDNACHVSRTPKSHDGGADVIARKENNEYLIQCKQTGNQTIYVMTKLQKI